MEIFASDDVSAANWMVERLHPFRTYLAGSVAPTNYEAYARILHPVFNDRGEEVRWSDIAAWSGRVYHPAMQFESIATPRDDAASAPKPWSGDVPYSFPFVQATALSEILSRFTTTSQKVWYCIWEGYGNLPKRARPRVRREGRNYCLYVADLCAVPEFSQFHGSPPEYWFPDDRAWCVAGDVDLYWTYVGGSKRCIEAILDDPRLEAVPAELEHGLTVDSDALNRLTVAEKAAWHV